MKIVPHLMAFAVFASSVALTTPARLWAQTAPSGEIQLLPAVASVELRQPASAEPLPPVAPRERPPVESVLPGDSRPQTTMSLADFEGLALANNPSLAQLASRVEALRGEWVQVGLPPNPVVGYVGSEIGNDGRAGQQGGFIGQEIVTGKKLALSRSVAAQDVRAAEQRLEAQRLRVISDVRIAFYDALVAQRRVQIADELVRLVQRGAEIADQFLKHGEGNQVDLLQARVELSGASILRENSTNDAAAAWRRLTAITATPAMPPAPLAGDLAAGAREIAFAQALEKLLTDSPELETARAEVACSRQALRRAAPAWSRFPTSTCRRWFNMITHRGTISPAFKSVFPCPSGIETKAAFAGLKASWLPPKAPWRDWSWTSSSGWRQSFNATLTLNSSDRLPAEYLAGRPCRVRLRRAAVGLAAAGQNGGGGDLRSFRIILMAPAPWSSRPNLLLP